MYFCCFVFFISCISNTVCEVIFVLCRRHSRLRYLSGQCMTNGLALNGSHANWKKKEKKRPVSNCSWLVAVFDRSLNKIWLKVYTKDWRRNEHHNSIMMNLWIYIWFLIQRQGWIQIKQIYWSVFMINSFPSSPRSSFCWFFFAITIILTEAICMCIAQLVAYDFQKKSALFQSAKSIRPKKTHTHIESSYKFVLKSLIFSSLSIA